MIPPLLRTEAGQRVVLGERVGGGGEGEVFALANRPNRLIKLYHERHRRSRAPKIAAMIAEQLWRKSDLVAFPLEAAFDNRGLFIGFLMRRVTQHLPVIQLYNPAYRRNHFPRADFAFLVRAAANTARAMAGVHYAGCVVGDLNESGVLVAEQATVALIDADSFQVGAAGERHLCGVGKDEFTPPELRGRDLEREERTRNHDAFGLATLIFYLLFMGRHPFTGVGVRDIELGAAIREYRFAYGARRTGLSPPPGTPRLADMSPMLAAAFEAAFAPVGGAGLRPRPVQWVDYLQRFERELVACPRSPRHRYHPSADACPWCRIRRETGRDPF